MRKEKAPRRDNTVLFSSLLLDACIVPVSVPVCHLDSRQLQQPLMINELPHQVQQYQQNNSPHLAYQQANHHSYTTVTTSNQHGLGPNPSGVMGPMGQQGQMPPHMQQVSAHFLLNNSIYFNYLFIYKACSQTDLYLLMTLSYTLLVLSFLFSFFRKVFGKVTF